MFSQNWLSLSFGLRFLQRLRTLTSIKICPPLILYFFALDHELGLAFEKRMQQRLRADMTASACVIKSNSSFASP